ncbi:DNA-directed DNA polymerase [Tanacetum coccineum]
MEEMLYKFIDEGKREHEEMRAFICDFQTTNELLFKERNNSLIELRFGVQELLKVMNNVQVIDYEVKGVTTRGGKTTTQDVHDNNTDEQPEDPPVIDPNKLVGSKEVLTENQPQKTNKPFFQPSSEVQTPPVPFPIRLRKEKDEAQQKTLLTNKARLEEACKITMNERCSAVLLNKLPSKEKDPGSFTIPCDIGQLHIDNALADLGASISLMPYTMYEKLSLGEPKATRMSLELADRPFLATARAMIDVFNEKITLRVGDDEVIFDVDQLIKRPTTEEDECFVIDNLDDTINEEA